MLRILIGAVFAIVMLVQLLPLLRGESWGVLEAVFLDRAGWARCRRVLLEPDQSA
ncbi:hypothetical protein [Brevibacterium luteolum]|uniref:hypothetical protein n=1 Tax=Brevibacterium luteolum TaxID=199591 RepID=UPI003B673F39